MSQDDQLIYF